MSRIYSALDPAQLGPNLVLEDAGRVVTHDTNGDNLARVVRGTIAHSDGVRSFEAAAWGDDEPVWAIGICTAAHFLDVALGTNTESIAWQPKAGILRYDNLDLPVPVVDVEAHVGLVADFDALTLTCYVAGSAVGSRAIPGGKSWFPAETAAGATAQGTRVLYRAEPPFDQGTGPFAAVGGWFEETAAPATVRVGGRGSYISQPGDEQPNTAWPDAIDPQATWFERSVHFWCWGGEGRKSSYGEIVIRNPPFYASGAGRWDYLLDADLKGEVVELARAVRGSSHDAREVIGTPLVERVYAGSPNTIHMALQGALSRLDKPMPRRVFPPWTPQPWAPQPIIIGACRQAPAFPLDSIGVNYLLSDRPLSAIVAVREGGQLHVVNTDWTLLPDARGIALAAEPVKPVTADISSAGGEIYIPPAEDVLAAVGSFLADGDSDTLADGWVEVGDCIPTNGYTAWASGTQVLASTLSAGASPVEIRTAAQHLLAGTTYRVTIEIEAAYPQPDGYSAAWWCGPYSGYNNAQVTGTVGQVAGTFSFIYTPVVDSYVHVGCKGYQFMRMVKISAVPAPAYAAAPIAGCTIEAAVADVMKRNDVADADWVRADAQAIEAGPFGWQVNTRDVSGKRALKEILDNVTAAIYEDELGRARIARLRDPDAEAPGDIAAYIRPADVLKVPTPQDDLGPALATTLFARLNGRRLTESEFVESLFSVPAATRIKFIDPGQLRGAVIAELARVYAEARQREPRLFGFDNVEDAIAELARVLALYVNPRRFTVVELRRHFPAIHPGSVVEIDYPRWGMAGGVRALVYLVGVRTDGAGQKIGLWY